MEYINCNLCGSNDLELIYEQPNLKYFSGKEIFKIVKCRKCGLGFVNPRPNIEEIQKYYPSSFYDEFGEKMKKRYSEQAKYLKDLKPGRLLDIGCANGDFPLFMKKQGWDVWGTEIGLNARGTEEEFPICKKQLPECKYPSEFFDAVTSWAVFEHLHNPMSYFKEVYRILKPGGRFIFLVTNLESLSSSKLFQEDIPRHLYFFSIKTVKMYIEKVGLSFKKIDFNNRIFSMSYNGTLIYFLKNLFGKKYTWQHSTFCYQKWLKYRGAKRNLINTLLFLVIHPLCSIDSLIVSKIAEKFFIIKKNYGIMIVVAEKKGKNCE